jgi:predicted CoA-substrate-specific enzyme activase
MLKIGLDIGSTTIKCVVIGAGEQLIFSSYERHFSQITAKTAELLQKIAEKFPNEKQAEITISGSAGMGLAQACDLAFVQEVYATRAAVSKMLPESDVVVELGGEDAKILFLSGGLEVRMNGSCAGGTGAFIDQMSALLQVTPLELNELAGEQEKIYTVASRCGVFAKSDIQPLLNQGARKQDIAASIFYAVVNQTVGGLAQGREICGRVVYLGGPLTFFSQLRHCFDVSLGLEGVCPENSLYYVAIGAVLAGEAKPVTVKEAIKRISGYESAEGYKSCTPLFADKKAYEAFKRRHERQSIATNAAVLADTQVYIGIDAGSTTLKAVVINSKGDIIHSEYKPNNGNPVPLVLEFLREFYKEYPHAKIAGTASTGYGEDIIKNAFKLDFGLVETMAHFTAAKRFQPEVDFIIDIGGQDIKCFKIHNGAIDNIFLNEACSSGCGSFLQTFAGALGLSTPEFAQKGLFAENPVDLGSRCTVFMNSSVKQAQKDGASVENISAGLSISVVKNALYKVIRTANAENLGKHIVVQGGTFLNDAVLRAFEQEIGREVVRPSISGLMGAYGAALYAKAKNKGESSILSSSELQSFTHEVRAITCKGCGNSCKLTVNTFDGSRKFIGGNRCEKPLKKETTEQSYNLCQYKRDLLSAYQPIKGNRGKIGIPMGLSFYELLPFWHSLFTHLGFEVITSPQSNRKLYLSGQHTIPSDTVCFPAKLIHGHIEALLKEEPDAIFYPCMTYNINEEKGDNHYNCPVVAYYPEVLSANINALSSGKTVFISDYIGIHDKRSFIKKFFAVITKYFPDITKAELILAAGAAYGEYDSYLNTVREAGKAYLKIGRDTGKPVIVLAERPYHLDHEVNHGIDQLISEAGAVVVTDDSVCADIERFKTSVLNQWTYHARMYSAAKLVAESKNLNMIQLVSFGCGVDAVTSDEIRSILESGGKIYTQVKIDEITNLGAVKIRLRSLFAALEQDLTEGAEEHVQHSRESAVY